MRNKTVFLNKMGLGILIVKKRENNKNSTPRKGKFFVR
jgi:hypothetical protein